MSLTLYNTRTRKKEEFRPIHEGAVRMYACGITVYDLCHVGHARSQVVFDVIYRWLLFKGFEVAYARNFTDIDDKIINRAAKENTTCQEVAQRYIAAFYEDMDRLKLLRPTVEPRATEEIPEMIELVETLIAKGHAYVVNGDVYFRVASFDGYGKLSGRNLEDMQAGARVQVDEAKENPLDFALWKASKEGEPWWDSPWGRGRPGWHLECSAMSAKYLKIPFDIHGGGQDLIFPHHENEIAQSEAAAGGRFVNFWLHNGYVNIDRKKMSKSLGNFITIRDVLEFYLPEELRIFLLSHHYRSPVDYSPESMREARVSLARLYQAVSSAEARRGVPEKSKDPARAEELIGFLGKIEGFKEQFTAAMDDDINTAKGLGLCFDLARTVNRLGDLPPKNSPPGLGDALMAAADTLRVHLGRVMGLLEMKPEEYLLAKRALQVAELGLDVAEIEELIALRAGAREEKDFALADEIRARLAEMRVVLEDSREGTTWRIED